MVGDVREIKYAIRTAANFAAFCALRGREIAFWAHSNLLREDDGRVATADRSRHAMTSEGKKKAAVIDRSSPEFGWRRGSWKRHLEAAQAGNGVWRERQRRPSDAALRGGRQRKSPQVRDRGSSRRPPEQ